MGTLTGRPAAGFGPWCDDIGEAERLARLREMRVLAYLLAPKSPLVAALKAAETGDQAALDAALAELNRLPALARRRILATYAALSRPA
jgi:hypothetical protein